MESPYAETERSALQCNMRARVPRQLVLLGVCLVLAAGFSASATSAPEPPRFQLSGTGTLSGDSPVQKSGNVNLKAHLAPKGEAIAASAPVQEGGGFAMIASLAAPSTACFNDTIFRDGFDGDGL